MQGFHIDELQNRKDIRDICSDLNKLVRRKNNVGNTGQRESIEREIEKRYVLLVEVYRNAVDAVDSSDKADRPQRQEQPDLYEAVMGNEKEVMATLLRSDKRNTKYYTVISKEAARKEITGLAEYYPEHNFYAVTDVMDEEGEECFTMVMDEKKDDPFGYYPALDHAKTEADRKAVMEEFLTGFEEYFIYSKPEDFFAK